MKHNRREFLELSPRLGTGALRSGVLQPVLHASPGGPEAATTPDAVCPKLAPPSRTLLALRIRDLDTLSYDEPFQNQPGERLPLTCLQGLVNQEKPRTFLVCDRFDEVWLDWLRERGDVKEVRWTGTEQLYEQFLPLVKGLIVTDPNLPASSTPSCQAATSFHPVSANGN
jgi:hypothetical protein